MVEPISIILISAAAGGVAGKFVEKAWDLGEKWLADYLKGHAPKAQERAQQNALDFLGELAQRVKRLEEQAEEQRVTIDDSLSDPGFSSLLQKAMISSAETNDKEKHELLARLVSDRLSTQSESPFALSSKLACDALSALNAKQLKMLGMLTTLVSLRPRDFPMPDVSEEVLDSKFRNWLIEILQIYEDLTFIDQDLLHLESFSCVKWDPIVSRELNKILALYAQENGFRFDYAAFSATDVGSRTIELWNKGLQHALPTTVGQLIGIYVSDMLSGSTTSLEGWWTECNK